MTDHTDHHGPEGLRTRGTIIVVPGRGRPGRPTPGSAGVSPPTPIVSVSPTRPTSTPTTSPVP